MGKGHFGCVVGESNSSAIGWKMKPPNYRTIEPAAIIARMFKRKAGAWLKISRATLLFKVWLVLYQSVFWIVVLSA